MLARLVLLASKKKNVVEGGASLRCDSVTYYQYVPLSRLDLLASKKKNVVEGVAFSYGNGLDFYLSCLPLEKFLHPLCAKAHRTYILTRCGFKPLRIL